MKFERAPDVQEKIEKMVETLELSHIDLNRIVCMRSHGSKSKALARIWNFPRIWQKALEMKPFYVIEVISHRFDKLGEKEQEKSLIHELLHVPKTFSGGLTPHKSFGKYIDHKRVDEMYKIYTYKRSLKERS